MLKKLIHTSTALFASALLSATPMIWNQQGGLEEWKAKANLKLICENGVLKLSEIKFDSQILSPMINIDPAQYNRISITYRGWNLPAKTTGQIFYSRGEGNFRGKDFWRIPALNGDGKWHTLILTTQALYTPDTWFKGGNINQLRLDPYDAAGGQLEIKEIKFFNVSEPAKVVSKKSPSYKIRWDEPEWPAVKPGFKVKESQPETYRGPYFAGKMIKSPWDTGSRAGNAASKTFFIRKNFTLRDKPVTAWVQFNADDGAEVYFNGKLTGLNSNWRAPSIAEVSDELKKGENIWAFKYHNGYGAGGVMAELYVEYADGSFERFDTDESFFAIQKPVSNWNNSSQITEDWKKVLALPGPPNRPWTVQLAYRDFSRPQHYIGGMFLTDALTAGEKVQIKFSFKGKIPELPFDGDIVLKRDNSISWKEKITVQENMIRRGNDNRWDVIVDFQLPLYNNGGKTELRLETGAIFCLSGGAPVIQFDMKKSTFPGLEKAKNIKMQKINGVPQIIVNNRPVYPVWFSSAALFPPGNVNVITVEASYGRWWSGVGKIDYPSLDYYAELAAKAHPNAWLIWDLSLFPPADWAEKYPEELCRDSSGAIVHDGFTSYSFASKRALADMTDAMVKAITYLENSPYADRIIGYRINGGHTTEWLGWDFPKGRAVDFSKPAKEGFKAFAAKYYPQLKDTSIPSLAEHVRSENGEILRDPEKNLRSTAFMDFYSQCVAEMIISLTRRARQLVPNKLLGTYYGYIMTLNSSGQSQFRAHYALQKILDANCIDFIHSPQAYSLRKVGDSCIDMKPFRSLQNRGIMSLIEDDTRTHMGAYMSYSNNFQSFNEEQTIMIIRRNSGIALCRMQPFNYNPYPNDYALNFPAMKKEIATIKTLGEHIIGKARHNAEIAYVISEESVKNTPMNPVSLSTGEFWQFYKPDGSSYAVSRNSNAFHADTHGENLTRISRLGAGVDYILAEDLHNASKDYKLYIFANCLTVDEKFIAAVEELRKKKCTLLWIYAPGLIFNGKSSVANMKRLTGFDFQRCSQPLLAQITTEHGKVGTPSKRLAPLFHVVPANGVKALGFYEDKSIGLAEKRTNDAVDIFCGVWQFDVPFLTRLAEMAGVHIYQKSGDPMESNSHLVSLHARFPGKKEIVLPAPATVLDVYNGKILGKNLRKITFEASLHSSHLFYLGSDAEALLKKLKTK